MSTNRMPNTQKTHNRALLENEVYDRLDVSGIEYQVGENSNNWKPETIDILSKSLRSKIVSLIWDLPTPILQDVINEMKLSKTSKLVT